MSLGRIAHFRQPAEGLHWYRVSPPENGQPGTSGPAAGTRPVAFVHPQGRHPPDTMPSEAVMRIGSLVLIVWLIIGAIAGGQRHYYGNSSPNCARAGTIAVTVLAGPLNYVGVNPKVACKAPQPSG